MSTDPRLYLDAPFSAGANLPLDKDQAHYLLTVMRRKAGDRVRVFNGRDGEWRAEIAEAGRRHATLAIGEQTRLQVSPPDMALYFAPVKKARTDFIVEKATELGARSITPVMTARTIADRVKTDRLAAIAREAAEQTERLDLPQIGEPVSLTALIKGWDADRTLIFCDEGGDDDTKPWGGDMGRAVPILQALHPTPTLAQGGGRGVSPGESASVRNVAYDEASIIETRADIFPSPRGEGRGGVEPQDTAPARKYAILIGPEGGFAPEERSLLRSEPFVLPVTLGPRILRADTAVVAAMSVWQALRGDWR